VGIKIYSPDEFLTLVPPSNIYLVNPIVPLGGIVFIYGKSGVGKSPLSWALADAVVKGGSFLGMPVSGQSPVLYVDVDTRWWTIQDRWKQAGYQPSFDIAVGDAFDCLAASWDYSDAKHKFKERQAEKHYKLVVISTLAKIHSFSFSDPNAPALVYSRWQEVFGEECAIAFIHHDKKSTGGDEGNEDTLYHTKRESFSGNQQWLDHCTVAIHLTRRGGDYQFTLEQVKDQGTRKVDALPLVLGDNGVGIEIEVEQTEKEDWLV
jgi:RecA-family ATPase